MSRLTAPFSLQTAVVLLGVLMSLFATAAVGCGGNIDVQKEDQSSAQLFNERCSGCHSLKAANAYGSKPQGQLAGGERTNGPNFNQRKVKQPDALYAIRNGGFSGAIMPANIVVGDQARKLSQFVSKYSGGVKAKDIPKLSADGD